MPLISFSLRDSISTQLTQKVFSIYLMVSIGITLVQFGIEYHHTEKQVVREIMTLQSTFEEGVTQAVWSMNPVLLDSIIVGIRKLEGVGGVQVFNERKQLVSQSLNLDLKSAQLSFQEVLPLHLEANEPVTSNIERTIVFSFPLNFTEWSGRKLSLGHLVVYSVKDAVFERVQYGYLLIALNAIIKTFCLGLILMYTVNHLLRDPLQILTRTLREKDPGKLEDKPVYLSLKDQNEIKELEVAFNRMNERYTQAMRLIADMNQNLEAKVAQRTDQLARTLGETREFYNFMAHELRTPVTAILQYSRFLNEAIKSEPLTDSQRKHLSRVQHNAERIDRLVAQALSLAILENTFTETEQSTRFLNEMVVATCSQLQGLFTAAVALEVSLDPNAERCRINPEGIETILYNLVSNAAKYTQQGFVQVSTLATDSGVKLIVKDSGMGIDPEQLGSVFQPFYRSVATMKTSGVGLGLNIVKKWTMKLNGTCGVESELGKGSTFWVWFPTSFTEK